MGSDSQTVEVSTVAALINAENGNVATTVTQTQVEEVPNSGNNLLFETKITPGFNIGFGTKASTLYQIDGENYNDPYNNANNSGASNLTLGLNDIQEASIIANGYSGQYGGLAGATASFVTKSGSNRLHGNASWFWTGRSLVANTYAHKVNAATAGITPRSFENANQWSALLSGPVTIPHVINGKDRLFFLADAEGLRAVLPASPVTVLVPSQNLQTYTLKKLATNGLTNSIPFYQNIFNIYNQAAAAHGIPVNNPGGATGNPNATNKSYTVNGTAYNPYVTGCGTNSLDATDIAGLGNLAGACTNYYASNATTFANEALEIFRVDTVLTQRDKMFVRYEHDAGVQPTTTDPVSPAFNAISIQPQHNGQLNETHIFGAKATNQFLLAGLWYGALFGPSDLNASLAVFPAQMGFSDSTLTTLGGSNASFPTGRNITTVQVQDDFALSQGAHTLKFGAKGYFIKENDHYFTAGTVPNIGVTTLGAFVNGGVDPAATYNITTGKAGSIAKTNFTQSFPVKPNFPVGYNQWAAYAEDDWKAARELSVSFALRVEHQGNISCLRNCITQLSSPWLSLNHTATIPYNQAYNFNQRGSLFNLQQLEWQPRIGFAYNPSFWHESMVVRGGFGIFYDGLAGSILEGMAKNPPTKNTFSNVNGDNLAKTETSNLFSDTAQLNSAFTNGITSGQNKDDILQNLPAKLKPFFTPPSVYTSQPNFHMPYIEKWNLEVQKQFGKNDVLSVNYMGNHGLHLVFTNAGLNAYSGTIAGLPTAPVDPRFNLVYYYQSGGSGNYNGLIVTATHKFGSSGSLITAGYTLGKALDTGANGFSTSTATGTTDIGAPVDPYHPNRSYGPASNDERHNLVLNYVYKVPFSNPFYGGWEVSGIAFAYTGLPYTVIDTNTTNGINGYTTGDYGGSLMANYSGGGSAACDYGKAQCLSTSQFTAATSVTPNQGRNQFRGPKYVTTDLAVSKSIPLHWEGGHLTLAAQAFNVLNHLNFQRPTGSLSSSTFGQVTATVNPSGIFSGVGGDDSPRILQLKMKLEF